MKMKFSKIGLISLLSFLCVSLCSAGALSAEEESPRVEELGFAESQEEGGKEVVDRKLDTDLGEIVVTGTRTEKPIIEAPIRTEVISRTVIDATRSQSLADAVEWTTGLRTESNCQNCNFNQIRMLGLDGKYTEIMYDSQPTMSALASVYGAEQIPTLMMERIEIVKGGGSALYGPGAVAGIINIIPREASENRASISTFYENMGSESDNYNVNAVAEVASPTGDTGAFLYGQVWNVKPLDLNNDGFTEISKRELQAFGLRAHQYLLERRGKVTLDYSRMYEDRRGGDNLHLPEFMANVAESTSTTRDVVMLSWLHSHSSDFDYRLAASFANTDRNSYYGAGMDPNAYGRTKNPYWILDSQFNHHFEAAGHHTLSWGVQGRIDDLEDSQPSYDRFTDERYTNVGFYLQDDYAFAENWELVLGGRVDRHSELDKAVFSPRAALMHSPMEDLRARLSLATGFLAPQVFDEDLHITQVGGEGAVIRNDPDLKEERSLNASVGAEYTPPIGDGQGLFDFNLFWTGLKDTFSVDEADDPTTVGQLDFLRTNRGGADVYGAEFNIGYQLPDIARIELGYVEQRSLFDDADPSFESRRFFRTPDRYGQLSGIFGSRELVQLFVGLRYTGGMKVPHYAGYIPEDRLESTRSFVTLDANLSKSFQLAALANELIVTVGGKNLTDEYQSDLDRGVERDAGYVYGPRFPRTFFAGMTYNF